MRRRRPPAPPPTDAAHPDAHKPLRKPTREELQVWDIVTQADKRLPHADIDWQQVADDIAAEAPRATPPKPAAKHLPLQPSDDQLDSLIRKDGFTAAGAAHAQPRATAGGVDKNSARRLRQGKLPIEATLDLHGLFREDAWQRLAHFLEIAYESQKRCVLVITGKGRFHADNDGRGGGVLRRELPRWLSLPPIAPWVLRHEQAQPHHGGEGAVYILLRRKR